VRETNGAETSNLAAVRGKVVAASQDYDENEMAMATQHVLSQARSRDEVPQAPVPPLAGANPLAPNRLAIAAAAATAFLV
jgi:hypothetical protein